MDENPLELSNVTLPPWSLRIRPGFDRVLRRCENSLAWSARELNLPPLPPDAPEKVRREFVERLRPPARVGSELRRILKSLDRRELERIAADAMDLKVRIEELRIGHLLFETELAEKIRELGRSVPPGFPGD